MRVTLESKYVVAEYNGKYWGIEYEDGHSTSYAFGPIEKADVSDSEFCKKATDFSSRNHHTKELKKARLVKVKKTTVFEIDLNEGKK